MSKWIFFLEKIDCISHHDNYDENYFSSVMQKCVVPLIFTKRFIKFLHHCLEHRVTSNFWVKVSLHREKSKVLWILLIYKSHTKIRSYCEWLKLFNWRILIYSSLLITCVLSPLVYLRRPWSQLLAAQPVDKRLPLTTAGCCRTVPWQTPTRSHKKEKYIHILYIITAEFWC